MSSPTLITNAKILTMDPANPRAEAMLLKDGRIAAIGSGLRHKIIIAHTYTTRQ